MLKVKETVYKGQLCIETVNPEEKDKDFIPAGNGKIGCVLVNTDKKLCLSKEVVEFLRNTKCSRDDIGDVDTFITDKDQWVFAWLGGMFSIKGDWAEGSRTHNIDAIKFETILNDTPDAAKEAVDTNPEEE